jgi:hypothetical protein
MSVRHGLWVLLPVLGMGVVHGAGCAKDRSGNDAETTTPSASGTGGGTSAGGGGAPATGAGGSGGAGAGGGAATSGAGGAGGAATSGAGGAGGGSVCSTDDANEENDSAGAATVLMPAGDTTPGQLYLSVWRDNLFLCAGDEDWFAIQTAYGDSTVLFSIRLVAAGAGVCGAGCDEYVPPAGPENTVTAEVYNASTMALVASQTSAEGRVWIDAFGPEFAENVLVRIYGPPVATYGYQFYSMVRSGYYEDECECLAGPTPDE